MTLQDKLKRLVELDIKHQRLKPLLDALIECVGALDIFKGIADMSRDDVVMTFAEDPSVIDYAVQPLANLERVVEGMEK